MNHTTTVHIKLKSKIFFCRNPSIFVHSQRAVGTFLTRAISRNGIEYSSKIFRIQTVMKSEFLKI